MNINCSWPFNNSKENDTFINLLEPNEIFEEAPIGLHNWIVSILNVSLSFTALFGNSAILITIWKISSLHSVANFLLASLAVSDLAVGLIVEPSFAAYLLTRNDIVRHLFNNSSSFLGCASFVTITAIIVDRFLVLQLHLRYHEVVTPFRVTLVVIFIWVFSGVRTLLSNLTLRFLDTVEFVTIISLLVGNFSVYLKIYLIVRRHQTQIQHQQQQQQQQLANNANIFSVTRFKKSALNTFMVYILLLFCYMPYCFALVDGGMSPRVYTITLTLIFLNSSLNPLLYCWRDREIRTAIKQVFCH
ncbi:melanocyte-stimulating hormone receptor-like [Oculina patagonica]